MKRMGWIPGLCATWLLGIFSLLALPTHAQVDCSNFDRLQELTATIAHARSSQPLPPQTALQQLARANVIYLGETHDRPADHAAQLAIIEALHCLRPQLAIGMEMFQRPYQSVLDRYLSGNLTETELKDLSQYQKRWGFEWEFYAPILRFAKQNRLPVLALNTPTEVTRKVSRSGLESLTLAERRFIPSRSAIVLEPESYRQRLREIYTGIHHGKSNSSQFEYFFQAQVLWDETMAERIAQILQRDPGILVVVLVGQGHLVYGNGLPSRVARRLLPMQPSFSQVSVLLNPPQEVQSEKEVADYFWFSP
ncbi:ChaN family lipoprotein [Kovacikia minuta CCNUW1]|uniref:ChaN family lipoprotein n=1 Tax=Kovacikia minuta TaxID=2931930 RepID=UPI001CCC768E|nr:ChaN family lipoprotein [Kovacikia minuta]UBF26273.1 ChaN family lipoprotein [Kovacikia minuta CCNUW1]